MAFDSWGLLDAARALIAQDDPAPSHCSRSISTTYYAIFQHVCCSASELLIGGPDVELTRAKAHLMRSIPHKVLRKRLGLAQNAGLDFPSELVSFANTFCTLQKHRHDADYDIGKVFSKADALSHIADADCSMTAYDTVLAKHRKAFIVWAILDRPDV